MFLYDFGLNNQRSIELDVKRGKRVYDTVHMDKGEGKTHFKVKTDFFNMIKEKYSHQKIFFITTELQQLYNPFYSELYDQDIKYKLDICVVFFHKTRNPVVLDVEIDGKEHYTERGRWKAEVRDDWMKERYNVDTFRVDQFDPSPNKFMQDFCSRIDYRIHCC